MNRLMRYFIHGTPTMQLLITLELNGGLKPFLHTQGIASISCQAKLTRVDYMINWKQKLASGFIWVFLSGALEDQSSTTWSSESTRLQYDGSIWVCPQAWGCFFSHPHKGLDVCKQIILEPFKWMGIITTTELRIHNSNKTQRSHPLPTLCILTKRGHGSTLLQIA